MATQSNVTLTVEQYERDYSNENGWEYDRGRLIRKVSPTFLHGMVQQLMAEVLTQAGFTCSPEAELRITPDWRPRPDVSASLAPDLSEPYPTTPVDIAVEILSPDETQNPESLAGISRKCRRYLELGIKQVIVLDPVQRLAWQWTKEPSRVKDVEMLEFFNGQAVSMASVWAALDDRIARAKKGQP
jgi:Uma2 family endonuclease